MVLRAGARGPAWEIETVREPDDWKVAEIYAGKQRAAVGIWRYSDVTLP